ncbi:MULTISPECIES: GntR family transcriptional regulator [Streptococcus]|uniref:GntR family transcriptional regulator n=5 Tax=Streptococcus TaxID=1301 RepID=A0A9X7XB61_STRDY|nr:MULTISPECIES: GntR family transcriptional regulator [Streptococcus]MSU87171.1 GntR family transcriptional regulator [Streptococcus dysgalactiae subsp. dysgalactiae]QGG98454.1 GntR family transcriptional regulator [Streptococcus dysgalactiae subsp. dysgalactiae]QGH02511.1 GntR family transcriptional regulator [Streptococcus dysgalactiae subsp. dysgalactiae]QGH04441.1 GntR family transcriptional regulator [Streptococcus dysgalactiae subsp. dysgalactiae]QKG73142.1 substrate-binding domain-cont
MTELLYKKIYHFIKEQIESGRLQIGDRLPTEKELSEQFSVSRITSKRALVELEQEGLITRSRGKGSFVAENQVKSPEANKDLLLILPFASDYELGDYAKGIMTSIAETGYRLMVQLASTVRLDTLSDYAGIIYYPEDVNHSIDFLFYCDHHHIPLVLLDKSLDLFQFPAVVADNKGGAYQLTQHLIDQGCDQIWFVATESFGEVSSVRDRYLGYLAAMAETSLPSSYFPKEKAETSDAYLNRLVTVLSEMAVPKTGLVVENDWLAIQLIQKSIQTGLSIPDQVAIVGFDNSQASRLLHPKLSTAAQDFYQMGQEAARLLLQKIESPQKAVTSCQLPVQLFIRESSH